MTPTEEIRAAAEILRARDDWASGTLMWWLADTLMLHVPEGGYCVRDEDQWPCHDIQAARKAAEAIRITNPAEAGGTAA
jgi:hypothetical protein